jgi:hypothetical protein
MTSNTIVIRLHEADIADLEQLRTELPGQVVLVETRRFDGAAVVEALVTITVSALVVVRRWLIERGESQRATTVIVEGMELAGYNADDVATILAALPAPATEASEPGSD